MKRLFVVAIALVLFAVGCDRSDLIDSPGDGDIVAGATVSVTGTLPSDLALGGVLTVNDQVTTIQADRSWSTVVPHATSGYVTPIEVVYDEPGPGAVWRQRRAVVRGESLSEGEMSPEGVGMRVTSEGLASLGPVIKDLAGGAFDIGGLLMAQNPIIDQENAFLHFDITGNVYEAGVGDVDIVPTTTDAGVRTDITVNDLYVGLTLNIRDGAAINTNCGLELQIPTTTIDSTFDLEPAAGDPTHVDVNQVGPVDVTTGAVGYEFISGICDGDTFLIGDIVNAVAGPQVKALVGDGFASNLGDPDGAGPADSPIAGAIQTALAEISIAGPVGEALGAHLDAPFTSITESAAALDLRADADFYATPGAGPGDCAPVPGAPDLSSTYDVAGSFPTLGATTPSGAPYGLGLPISASAFNQLLGAMTECGALNQSVTEFPLGTTSVPITSTLLSTFVPELAEKVPAGTPMRVQITPTVAPFVTSEAGPNGEPAELMLANLQITLMQDRPGTFPLPWLQLVVDAPLGFDLGYDAAAGQLSPTITPPPASEVDARVVVNPIGTNEPAVEGLFANLFPTFAGALSDSFGAFPLPSFLGLDIDVVQVARQGNYFVLYANLDTSPQTRIENVTIADQSSGDSATDTVFDVNEWRHRIRPKVTSNSVAIDFKGMLGADACCTVDDESRGAHAGLQVDFDVVPANGETWRIDLNHLIRGAHTIIDEHVALEWGGGQSRFTTPISAQARVGSGGWQQFGFNANPSSLVDGTCWGFSCGGSGTKNVGFSGANGMVLTGTTAQHITVQLGFDMFVKSESNVVGPAVGGDEAALRFGANDTIANGFTAGSYPGLGNRSLIDDGYFATIALTSTP